ncbi:MAG: phosphoenolpyruvate carboxykinase (ATP), partial [Gemmatimonadetes bacterium]|nr:phosphoenolpyruvate carboxykinase (ATP) [Gemmatimonadota bacterium]
MLVAEAPMIALRDEGLSPRGNVNRNLSPAELYERTLRLGTGRLAHGGGLVTVTAPHTGRSPNDRFIVREPGCSGLIDWGDVNAPIGQDSYALLRTETIERLNGS